MDKSSFLSTLRESLEGQIPEFEIVKNINYYSDYISFNEDDNRTEEDRLKELGDPRLIARTIVDAYKVSKESIIGNFREASRTEERDYTQEEYFDNGDMRKKRNVRYYSSHMPWYQKAIGVLSILLILIIILVILGVFLELFFTIVLPILIVFIVVKLIYNLIK